MSYCGYEKKKKNVRKHPNADRLLLGECFGNIVCVSTEYKEDQVGVYFPTDGQLSVEFAEQNNLLRKKDENGNNIGGYMDPDKRNVTSIKLRGEKSDGLFLPLTCLMYTGIELKDLHLGDTIVTVNGHEICQKYIPKRKVSSSTPKGNRVRKKKVPVAPLFIEHADTEQLAYNLDAFKYGDLIVLVEGAIDRDVCSLFITKNCLSVLTSTVTRNQLQVLQNLTNKVLLILDNDEAGINGENQTKRKLQSAGITCYTITKSDIIKDLGDLLELKRKKDIRANIIIQNYRAQVQIHGGKLV